jgi:hypothetical protein
LLGLTRGVDNVNAAADMHPRVRAALGERAAQR